MAQVTLRGNPCDTCGDLPQVGEVAPSFALTNTDLSEVTAEDFQGKRVVLNIFPSVDTSTCAASVRRFNEEVSRLENTVVLCISHDLPFAHKRFCAAEELERVIPLSMFRDTSFGDSYGVQLIDGPLEGLFARAVVVLDEDGQVLHRELVPEIADEPNYAAVLKALA